MARLRWIERRERTSNMGVTLSGGEQQMLAIGRALMTNPRLLILDEATEGLAPLIRDEIWSCLSMLKGRGQSVLVIDKNVGNLARIADRHYIIERGKTVWSGTSEQLLAAGQRDAHIAGALGEPRKQRMDLVDGPGIGGTEAIA